MSTFVTSLRFWAKGLWAVGHDNGRILFAETLVTPGLPDPLTTVANLIEGAASTEHVVDRVVSNRLPPLSVDGSQDTVALWCQVSAVMSRALHLVRSRTPTADSRALEELAFDDLRRAVAPPWNPTEPGNTVLPSSTGDPVDIGTPVLELIQGLEAGSERVLLDSLAAVADKRFLRLANRSEARFSADGSFGVLCGLEAWLYYLLAEEARTGYLDWKCCLTCGRHFRANRRGRPRMYCERLACRPRHSRAARHGQRENRR